MKSLQKAILHTLAYADVFDYPLSLDELYRFIIADELTGLSSFKKALTRIKADGKRIEADDEYFFLKGRQKIVAIREKRKKWSREKTKVAEKATRWLKIIPWVEMVAVTGSLAMKNSEENDDIDLLIITAKSHLWLTRGIVVLFLRILGLYRQPNKIKNKICPNMFLDEEHLSVPKKERDIFSAHEVCQLRPVWDRDNIYKKFLEANRWAKRYLPNVVKIESKLKMAKEPKKNSVITLIVQLINFPITFFETLAYRLQLAYMKPRRTSEVVDFGRILFHPNDARKWILVEYENRLEKLGIKD